MYHRFGEQGFPSTNTTIEQFEAHLDELTSGAYTVLPLIDITRAILAGESLPDRSVAITIDDAFFRFIRAFPACRNVACRLPCLLPPVRSTGGCAAMPAGIRSGKCRLLVSVLAVRPYPSAYAPHRLEDARHEIEVSNGRFLTSLACNQNFWPSLW